MSANPARCCDLVMKGGVTSGVIYPKAVEEVAKRFHLVGIAGTSAGAIAASLAAAAEYRRRHGGGFDGFEQLGALAEELAEPHRLLSLFTPDDDTKKLFRRVRDLSGDGLGVRSVLRLAWTLFARRGARALRDNFFGLCTGMANGNGGESVEPLSSWLAEKIDTFAGRPPDQRPLTFRDLAEAPRPEVLSALVRDPSAPSIDFRAVSTNLTFGRPFELPFQTNIFAFDPDEWRKIFPGYVVDFLVEKAGEIPEKTLKRDGKLPLTTQDLPVVVATRMSLSFPVLLSMVPLWAVDYRKDDQPMERVWFSDGGITSNFPIHRFDDLYPLWPTLGMTLASTGPKGESIHPGRRDSDLSEDEQLIYLPRRPQDGRLDRFGSFGEKGGALSNLFGFLRAIFSSAQNWHDKSFMPLPGYRGRTIEISTKSGEGGLELDMDPEVVRDLAERGRRAGEMLAERFADPDPDNPMGWDAHRWTRFRSGMNALVTELRELHHSVRTRPMGGGHRVEEWLDDVDPPSYKYDSVAQRKADREAFERLMKALDQIFQAAPDAFPKGPKPRAEFGTRASL